MNHLYFSYSDVRGENSIKKMKELFKMLLNGGKILSSNDLSILEISEAKAERRMWVCDKGYGFVYIPSTPKICIITN